MEGPRTRALGRAPVDPLVERRAFSKIEAKLFGPRSQPVVLHRYVLLERVGAGGTGTVFAAYDPELDRKIAIKVLHAGPEHRGGDEARARLVREARAAAKLTHPNVIRIYDVGTFDPLLLSPVSESMPTTPDTHQTVFVAMELVEGTDLRRWVQRAPRSWREILEVFCAAGRGLLAAHEAGIVHRDFKPGNVLIADDGRVLVADFGLARATSLARVDASGPDDGMTDVQTDHPTDERITQTGTLMGTLAFMAPEQHQSPNVDARADQFAFCASLYRCLFGELPFEHARGTDPAQAKLRGEVRPFPTDTRVPAHVRAAILRGLAARPDDRFPSMRELLQALERDPWRARKRGAVLAGVVGLVGAAGAAIGTRSSAPSPCAGVDAPARVAWTPARRDAVTDAFAATRVAYAQAAAELAVDGVDAWVHRWVEQRRVACETTHVRGIQSQRALDLRLACLDVQLGRLEAALEVLASADATVVEQAGRVLTELPDPRVCAEPRVMEPRIDPPPADRAEDVAEIQKDVGRVRVLLSAGRTDEAEDAGREVLARARQLDYPPLLAEALLVAGATAGEAGRREAGLAQIFDAALWADAVGDDHLRAEATVSALQLATQMHALDEAEREAARTEAVLRRLGPGHRLEASFEMNLGVLRYTQGRLEDALGHAERALQLHRNTREVEDLTLAKSMTNLGSVQWALGRLDEAIATLEEACAVTRRILPEQHPQHATCVSNLGNAYFDAGRYADALQAQRRALAIREAPRPPDPRVADTLNNIGNVLLARGAETEALRHYERALAIKERHYGPDDLRLATTLCNLAEVLNNLDRHEEALTFARRAEAIERARLGTEASGRAYALTERGRALFALGRIPEATVDLREALRLREAASEEVLAVELARTKLVLAAVLDRSDPDEARALREAVARLPREGRWDLEALDRWLKRWGS